MRRLILSSLAVLAPVLAFSQIGGIDEFPQFRTWSGLPGSGSAITANGRPMFRGAMGISTPIAYSLSRGYFSLGLGNTSYRNQLDFFNSGNGAVREDTGNGTGWVMGGFSTGAGNFTVGGMVLSRVGDNVLNLHFQPNLPGVNKSVTGADDRIERFDIGIGVQDVFSTGGTSGETLDRANGGGNSRSFYAVGTARLTSDFYVSVGTGTRRFEGVFGSANYNIHPRVKLVGEYDAFNWNYGVAFDLGSFTLSAEKDFQVTAFLGQIRAKYLTWGLSVAF